MLMRREEDAGAPGVGDDGVDGVDAGQNGKSNIRDTAANANGGTDRQRQRPRLTTPLPSAAEARALLASARLGDPNAHLAAIRQRQVFVPRSAKLNVQVVNAAALAPTSLNNVLSALLTENDHLAPYRGQIGTVTRSRGCLLLKVTDVETQVALDGQSVTINGNVYKLAIPNQMGELLHIDVFGVEDPEDAESLFRGFTRAGHACVYFCPRDVHTASGITTSTWRFYFTYDKLPAAFVVNGHAVNRILSGGRIYYVNTKDAPYSGSGTRTVYQISLPVEEQTTPAPGSAAQGPQQGRPNGQGGAGLSSSSSKQGNNPGQGRPTNDIITQTRKRTRTRLMSAEQGRSVAPRQSVPLYCHNFFSALADIPVNVNYVEPAQPLDNRFARITATAEDTDVSHPDAFVKPLQSQKKHKSKVEIGPAVTAGAVAMALQSTEVMDEQAMMTQLPDAKVRSLGVKHKLQTSRSMDAIVSSIAKSPLAATGAMAELWNETPDDFLGVVEMHTCNRATAAVSPSESRSNHDRLERATLPTGTREKILTTFHQLVQDAPTEVQHLIEDSRAIAAFDLLLMALAPTLYKDDAWVSTLTGGYTDWIAHSTHRLLTARQLCALLASDVGAFVLSFCQQHNMPPGVQEALCRIDWPNVGIATLNCRGIRGSGQSLINRVICPHFITCLQESRFKDARHHRAFRHILDSSVENFCFVTDPNVGSPDTAPRAGGVVTVIHKSLPRSGEPFEVDQLTRVGKYLVVAVPLGESVLYVHNIYAPTGESQRRRLFAELPRDFPPNALHIVCGDFNNVQDDVLDSATPRRQSERPTSHLLDWMSNLDLIDPWRRHHPCQRVYSSPPRARRIDFILMSQVLCDAAYKSSSYVEYYGLGDHLAHKVQLSSSTVPQGPGYWRFPAWILDYPETADAIRHEIAQLLPDLRISQNPGILWQIWKNKLRAKLILLARNLRDAQTQPLATNLATLRHARLVAADPDASEREEAALNKAQEAFDIVARDHAAAARDSGFDRYALEAETSSRFFFRPPSYSLRRVPISCLTRADGSSSTVQSEVYDGFQEHWGRVFGDTRFCTGETAERADRKTLCDSIRNQLSVTQRDSIDAPVTAADYAASIRRLRNHSAPGPDGFTAEFFKIDPDTLSEVLYIVFEYQRQRGILLPSQRTSAVILLHKKGDRGLPGNYRPISLLPVEVKILSKVLTARVLDVLGSLIHTDQKGFVPGRSIHHHVRLIHDLQDLCTKEDTAGLAAFLDFEKAYDRVDHEYLKDVLVAYNFGSSFCQWVDLLYRDAKACLCLNGWMQEALRPGRGVKQGDPLSVVLFTLCVEPLGNLIRARPDLGLPLGGAEAVTGAYFADDSTLFPRDLAALDTQLRLVDVYCRGSGARLNRTKSQLLTLNRKHPPANHQELGTVTSTIVYLGITIGPEVSALAVQQTLEDKLKAAMHRWRFRARTMSGRRLLVNTVVLSALWHFTPHYDFPQETITRWQRMIANYILYGTQPDTTRSLHLISKAIHGMPTAEGGIQIPQIAETIKRQRFKILQELVRIGTSSREPWTQVAGRIFTSSLGAVCTPGGFEWLWTSPKDWPKHHLKTLPKRWISSWSTWAQIEWPSPAPERGLWTHAITAANSSIWLALRPQSDPTARALYCTAAPSLRPICESLMRAGYSTAASFRTEEGLWPSYMTFYELAATTTRPSSTHRIFKLYTLMTRYVYPTLPIIIPGPMPMPRSYCLPRRGLMSGDEWVPFPHLSKHRCARILATHPAALTKPHPFVDHGLPPGTDVRSHVRTVRAIGHAVTPVVRDVYVRLSFKLLPTGSRLWRGPDGTNNARKCSLSDCGSIETEQHLFLNCDPVFKLWRLQWTAWSQLLVGQLTWSTIIFPYSARVQPRLENHRDNIIQLWHIAACILLHQIWRDRNARVFDAVESPAMQRRHAHFLSVFAAHVRSLRRRHHDDPHKIGSINVLLDILCSSTAYGPIRTQTETPPRIAREIRHLQIWTTRTQS